MSRKYTITLNEEQLMLISNCIEDIHRFLSGQTELWNTINRVVICKELTRRMNELQPLITPGLKRGSSYGWNGANCPNDDQRKLIAQTYYLYREMLHQYNLANDIHNVYSSPTPRCADSGEPIKITWEE